MSLTKEQYDSIMLRYAEAQNRRRREVERRRNEVYARVPAYRTLDAVIPERGMEALKKRLFDVTAENSMAASFKPLAKSTLSPMSVVNSTLVDNHGGMHGGMVEAAVKQMVSPLSAFRDEIASVTAQKRALLQENGFPADYLEVPYDCPVCRDTGYVGGEKCRCFRAQEIALLYDQSGIRTLARAHNFATLSEEFYKGEDLTRFRKTLMICQDFLAHFPEQYRNLYFYGNVGTGKTFLSVCIAHELIERGFSVLYFSASSLFDRIAACSFDFRDRARQSELYADLYGCELLIIDDLGSELTNAFVASELFSCLNERSLRRRPTIISSNLSLSELRERYSERVFSRITCQYELCKITGPDIRVLVKRRHLRK